MKIEIIGTESLGVRGLSCFIIMDNRKILIDPGVALGYKRHGLLPHPLQVAVGEKVQQKLSNLWQQASDIVISHFHGDHVPLEDANPYQLKLKKLPKLSSNVKIWSKNISHLSELERKRFDSFSFFLNEKPIAAEGISDAQISFSKAVPHGVADINSDFVMMTRIKDDFTFVHTSDIQLLNDISISQILKWKPDIVLAGGPPLYLANVLSKSQINRAWENAVKLAKNVKMLILDHHLLRNKEGEKWLQKLSEKTENKVICAADFMHRPRMLLEANRSKLYEKIPVPENWHKKYAAGNITTSEYEYSKLTL